MTESDEDLCEVNGARAFLTRSLKVLSVSSVFVSSLGSISVMLLLLSSAVCVFFCSSSEDASLGSAMSAARYPRAEAPPTSGNDGGSRKQRECERTAVLEIISLKLIHRFYPTNHYLQKMREKKK